MEITSEELLMWQRQHRAYAAAFPRKKWNTPLYKFNVRSALMSEQQAALPVNTLRNQDGTAYSANSDGNTFSVTPEQLAQMFHETYERLAPDFGYKTREASAKPWSEVPEQNKSLMIAVAGEILRTLVW